MKKNRILLEIDRLNLSWSGVEKSLLYLRKLLLEMNYDVDVCGINNINNSTMNVIETLSYEALEFTNYDIIILSLEGKDLLNFINKVDNPKAKIVKIVHGDPDHLVERYEHNYLKMYKHYNLADKLIFLNEIFLKGLPSELLNKSSVIGHSIDWNRDSKVLDSKNIIYVGRYDEPNKQVIKVLESWKDIKKQVLEAEFHIYGEGPAKAYYNKMIKKGKLKDVFLNEKVEDVDAVLRDAKLNVLLSKSEGLPLSILEGINCGIAPLVSGKSKWAQNLMLDEFKVDIDSQDNIVDNIVKLLTMDLEDYNSLVSHQQSLILESMSSNRVREKWDKLLSSAINDYDTEVSSRELNSFYNHQILTTSSENKLKKEYETLLAKYQYVLSLLAKK